ETAIAFLDGLLGPLIDIGVPDWAVISGSRGNAAKRVVRPMPGQKRGTQALTLRIVAAAFRCAVRGDEDPLYSATLDVVDSGLDPLQAWSESVPLDGGHCGIARLGRDVKDRFAKAIAVDQGERDSPMRRINGHHLIMYESVVRVSVGEVDIRIFHRSGDDGRVVDDASDVYQRAVVPIADGSRLSNAGWERSFFRAGHDLPVW